MQPISVGQGGRLTAWCDSQPEDLLQRDEEHGRLEHLLTYTALAARLLDSLE